MSKRNIIIIVSVVLIIGAITGLLLFLGVGQNQQDPIESVSDGLQEISDNTVDILGDPITEPNFEITDFEEIDLEPLIYSQTAAGTNLIKYDTDFTDSVYLEKLESLASEPLDIVFLKDDLIASKKVVVLQENTTKTTSMPSRAVSDLFEMDYNSVKYWVFVDSFDGSLYISLENFENPRQIRVGNEAIFPQQIEQVQDQSTVFWAAINQDNTRKLVKLDFGQIPFDKWSELDFLLEVSSSQAIESNLDTELLERQRSEYLSSIEDLIGLESYYDFRFFNYFVTANDKVLIQVPGIPNQFVLLNGQNTLLIKLDADFGVGDGYITCENSENICVVFYPNVGLYRIDVTGAEPIADNISPIITDKGDGVFDETFSRVYQEFGFDSERLLDYENGQVIIWIDGAKFILGDFNEN